MTSYTAWLSAANGLSFVVSLGVAIAFVVVSIVVRRTRPDAFAYLLSSALVYLGNLLFGTVVNLLLPMATYSTGVSTGALDRYAVGHFVVTAFERGVGLLGTILLILAILRLARPPLTAG